MMTNQDMHFVGHKQPFVCISQTNNVPFVCSYKPFVEISQKSALGFTLIEVLVTVIIAGILTAAAVSSFGRFTQSTRLTTATNDLISDISLARIESLKRQGGQFGTGQAVVCVSTDGSSCASAGTNWNSGWIVFWDDNGDNAYSGGNDILLRVHSALPTGLSVTTTPVNTASMAFTKLGALQSGIETDLQITNTVINKNRYVCTSIMGRAMAAPNTATSC